MCIDLRLSLEVSSVYISNKGLIIEYPYISRVLIYGYLLIQQDLKPGVSTYQTDTKPISIYLLNKGWTCNLSRGVTFKKTIILRTLKQCQHTGGYIQLWSKKKTINLFSANHQGTNLIIVLILQRSVLHFDYYF